MALILGYAVPDRGHSDSWVSGNIRVTCNTHTSAQLRIYHCETSGSLLNIYWSRPDYHRNCYSQQVSCPDCQPASVHKLAH
jgi:hypothetical protein